MATWTTTEAAAHCKISAARFRSLVAAAGISAVARQPGRAGENLYDQEAIQAMQTHRPRQGARTDLASKNIKALGPNCPS